MFDTIMEDPAQRERLLGNVWSEVFNHDGNIAYLNLIKEMKLRAEMDEQQAEPLNALIQRLQDGDTAALEEMKSDGQFANYLSDIELIINTLAGTHALDILQALLSQSGNNPDTVATESFDDLDNVSSVLSKPDINFSY
jgi:hypothetical protein